MDTARDAFIMVTCEIVNEIVELAFMERRPSQKDGTIFIDSTEISHLHTIFLT